MKKIFKYILYSISIVFILLIVSFFFNPHITRTLKVLDCEVEYTQYLIYDNVYCNMRTMGHCSTNEMSYYNAKMKIAQCLCKKYQSNLSSKYKAEILKSYTEYITQTSDIYEYIFKSKTPNIDSICKESEHIFQIRFIE